MSDDLEYLVDECMVRRNLAIPGLDEVLDVDRYKGIKLEIDRIRACQRWKEVRERLRRQVPFAVFVRIAIVHTMRAQCTPNECRCCLIRRRFVDCHMRCKSLRCYRRPNGTSGLAYAH